MRRRDAIQIGLHVWELQRHRVWGERAVVLGWGKRLLSPVGKALLTVVPAPFEGLVAGHPLGFRQPGLGCVSRRPDRR